MTSTPPEHRPGGRNIAPIRWPAVHPFVVAMLALFVVGVLLATLVPSLIDPLTQFDGGLARTWTAFGVSLVGIITMAASSMALHHRYQDVGLLIMAVAPTSALLIGAFAALATHGFPG